MFFPTQQNRQRGPSKMQSRSGAVSGHNARLAGREGWPPRRKIKKSVKHRARSADSDGLMRVSNMDWGCIYNGCWCEGRKHPTHTSPTVGMTSMPLPAPCLNHPLHHTECCCSLLLSLSVVGMDQVTIKTKLTWFYVKQNCWSYPIKANLFLIALDAHILFLITAVCTKTKQDETSNQIKDNLRMNSEKDVRTQNHFKTGLKL